MLGLVTSAEPGPPSFIADGLLALPLSVASAGFVLPFGNEFRLWITRSGETIQLRVTPERRIEELPPLPIVVAAVAACPGGFAVTGADAHGRAVALATTVDGAARWQHRIGGPEPTRWPAPLSTSRLRIVWQTRQGQLEAADADESGISRHHTFEVGGPPLEIAVAGERVWAVWSDASGILALSIRNGDAELLRLDSPLVSEIAVGESAGAVFITALQDDTTLSTWREEGRNILVSRDPITLPRQVRGALA